MNKEIKITVVDIWSTLYTVCLKDRLQQVGTIESKPVYKSTMDGELYMLTNSRFGTDFYV